MLNTLRTGLTAALLIHAGCRGPAEEPTASPSPNASDVGPTPTAPVAIDARVGAPLYRELVAPPGEAPFRAIQVFRVEHPTSPHWLFLTDGLHAPATRGELAIRAPLDPSPPDWAASLLLYLANYAAVAEAQVSGGYVDLAGPGKPTHGALVGVVVGPDPALAGATPVDVVVGVTKNELALVRVWSPAGWLEAVRPRNPLFVSASDRASLLDDPTFGVEVRARAEREGSATSAFVVSHAVCKREGRDVVIELGANGVRGLAPLLPARLGLERPLRVVSNDGGLDVEPGAKLAVRTEKTCTLTLPAANARDLARRLEPRAGDYRVGPGVLVRVVPSAIVDESGGARSTFGDVAR